MEVPRQKQLEAVMERMAAGDAAAVWTLADQFQGELRHTVTQHLVAMGRGDLRNDDALIAGLVLDTALLLFGTSNWRPGGALPWVWARLAIRELVSATVGHRSVTIEDDKQGEEAPSPVTACVDIDLDDLASRDWLVGKLREAISLVGSARDQQVHIDYRMQVADGDPSPSHTVADSHGLSAANVRQIDRRMKNKLRCLATANSEFSEIGDLRWLA